MIKEKQCLSMIEADDILASLKENDKIQETRTFIKKFTKIDIKGAKKLKEELAGLNILKLKRNDIVKIIDLLPENAAELNKIFTDIILDADETNKILETIKKFR